MNSVHGIRALLRPSLIGLCVAVAFGSVALAATPDATPATGPSWLDKLGRNFDKSALGRVGALGPNEQDPELAAPAPKDGSWLRKGFEVRGADLFRFTCRSCHGAGGRGMAPEILPLVNLVKATSAEWQKQQGAGAADRAKLAEKLLQHQITAGGRSMPGFNFLASEESEALLGYLEHLASIADPKHADRTLADSGRPGRRADRQGYLPDLPRGLAGDRQAPDRVGDSAALRHDRLALGEAVRRRFPASPQGGGQAGLKGKGPEVTYLRDHELEAAYFYLTAYPPR